MKLYLVDDRDRWGYSLNIVRAESEEAALALLKIQKTQRVEVVELPTDGPPEVLWCVDESPDTPRSGYDD